MNNGNFLDFMLKRAKEFRPDIDCIWHECDRVDIVLGEEELMKKASFAEAINWFSGFITAMKMSAKED